MFVWEIGLFFLIQIKAKWQVRKDFILLWWFKTIWPGLQKELCMILFWMWVSRYLKRQVKEVTYRITIFAQAYNLKISLGPGFRNNPLKKHWYFLKFAIFKSFLEHYCKFVGLILKLYLPKCLTIAGCTLLVARNNFMTTLWI